MTASAAAASGATCTTTAPITCTFPTQGPQQRILNYKRVLPNIGYTWALTPQVDVFGNYSKGLQVPGTDNLYNSFYFPKGSERATPKPETTDNFDLGVRYRSATLQAQLGRAEAANKAMHHMLTHIAAALNVDASATALE